VWGCILLTFVELKNRGVLLSWYLSLGSGSLLRAMLTVAISGIFASCVLCVVGKLFFVYSCLVWRLGGVMWLSSGGAVFS
jgi:hypothetical protein